MTQILFILSIPISVSAMIYGWHVSYHLRPAPGWRACLMSAAVSAVAAGSALWLAVLPREVRLPFSLAPFIMIVSALCFLALYRALMHYDTDDSRRA